MNTKTQKFLWAGFGAMLLLCIAGTMYVPNDLNVSGQITQVGGGIGLQIQGAIKGSSLGLNIADSNSMTRISISTVGGTTLAGSNGVPSLLIQKDGGVNLPLLTGPTAIGINASGDITNVAGGGATTLNDLTDVDVLANPQLNDVLTWNGTIWTNRAAFFQFFIFETTTNIFVGSNTEQIVTIKTNISFKLVFTGTPQVGETVSLSVSNYGASTIYMTNTAYDPTVASNVTLFAIPAQSIRDFKFLSNTNFTFGVQRWELIRSLQKESELAVAGQSIALLTNADVSIVTISNTYNGASQRVLGTLTGPTNFVCVLSTNSVNVFYCGSNNVNIVVSNPVANGPDFPIPWTIIVTNRTATPYTVGFVNAGAVTNNHLFMGTYGQAAPSVATNATTLFLAGLAAGTNQIVGYSYTGIFPP